MTKTLHPESRESPTRRGWSDNRPGMPGTAYSKRRARIERARNAAQRGLNISEWAREENVKISQVSKFVNRPDFPEEVRDALKANSLKTRAAPYRVVLDRVIALTFAEAGMYTNRALAFEWGVTAAAVTFMKTRYAPHGLDEALGHWTYQVYEDPVEAEEFIANTQRYMAQQMLDWAERLEEMCAAGDPEVTQKITRRPKLRVLRNIHKLKAASKRISKLISNESRNESHERFQTNLMSGFVSDNSATR